ncbi:hypothetical protein AH782_09670 [Salmonella enterica subsp. enterica]|nr:hypothetical protein [Salmonella enterica subsp. enterica serovar Rubislaw]
MILPSTLSEHAFKIVRRNQTSLVKFSSIDRRVGNIFNNKNPFTVETINNGIIPAKFDAIIVIGCVL